MADHAWARTHIPKTFPKTKTFYHGGVLYQFVRDEKQFAQLSKRAGQRWILIGTFVVEANDKMAKKSKKKKPAKKKWKPVQKPEGSHMPTCNRLNCNRIVSDARKTLCDRCNKKNDYYNKENWFDKYISGTEC